MNTNNENKKRILILSLAYFPKFVGGAEVAIKEITDRIGDVDFDIVTLRFDKDSPKEEKIGNTTVYRVGPIGKNVTPSKLPIQVRLAKVIAPWLLYKKANDLHDQSPYDIVWSMMANQSGIAGSFFKKKNPTVPFLLTLQEGDSPEVIRRKARPVWLLFKKVFRKADYVQTISNFLSGFAKEMEYDGPVSVVPNGVDVNAFSNVSEGDIESTKKELEISEHDFLVVTASRLVYKNGVSDLIKSLVHLPKNVKLLILGDGPLQNDLERLVREEDLQDRVIFKGFVQPSELPRYFKASDVFVRASISEGLGNVFLEAMAAGLPVVATGVGGIVDIVRSEETGLLAGVEDSKDIAAKINMVSKDAELYDHLVRNGHKQVEEKYSWDNISGQMKGVFEETISACSNCKRVKNILVATGMYPPTIGGPATHTKIIEKELPAKNFNVNVLSFDEVRYFPKIIKHIVFGCRLAKKVVEGDADTVYALDPVSVGWPAMIVAKVLRRRLVLRLGGDYAWEQAVGRFGVTEMLDEFVTGDPERYSWKVRTLKRLQYVVANNSEKVIVPSEYLKSVVEKWGIDSDKIVVIRNSFEGIDVPEQSKEELRGELGISGSEIVIFSAGRLVFWKGFETLIKVVEELPNTKLIIAGDGPLRKDLDRLTGEKVKLVGKLDKGELAKYVKASDLFVLNTGYEGLSHLILEVMSIGTPIVTTVVGGNMELMEGGKHGELVEYDNEEELKISIQKVLDDDLLAESYVTESKKLVKSFSKDKMINLLSQEL